jgi:anti-sigma factor RsiW
MCGLCGVFVGRLDWALGPRRDADPRELAVAARILAPFGVTVAAWSGRYLVRSRTGRTIIAAEFQAIFWAVQQLAPRPIDVLDPDCLKMLAGNH